MGGLLTQLFPPKPTFTEKDVPSLSGKVFIVTGGNSGVGLALVKILYSKGATIYIAGRSPSRIASAIEAIAATIVTSTPGTLKSLHLDLNDLTTVPRCASAFLAQESRLDVLWNNAGISQAPYRTTAQGYEAHMGVNCVAPFLLTKLLLPILRSTAATAPKGSVRVVFTTSSIIDMAGPPGGVSLDELIPGNYATDKNHNYSASKAGNWFLASEFDKRFLRKDGIICLSQNPGTLRTNGWNNVPWAMRALMRPFMYDPKMGAYTELWAGLGPMVKLEDGGRMVIPWGRWHTGPKQDIVDSLKAEHEGGTGVAARFFDWCDEQTRSYC